MSAYRAAWRGVVCGDTIMADDNPFDTALAREFSSSCVFRDGKLEGRSKCSPSALAEFAHHQFRALVDSRMFPCVAAKAAIYQGTYRFGMYPGLASAEATAGLSF